MSKLASKILVPIGFSKQSIIALEQAFNIAKIKKSAVFLLTVVEEQSILNSLFLDDKTPELQKSVKTKLSSLASEYSKKYNVVTDVIVAKGKVYKKINEVAEMISADLIVMGTHGSETSNKIIGSNAERVVRLASCPVITIKGQTHRNGCKNIILPLDLEKETKEKVTHAIEYARYWNSVVRIVSVVIRDTKEVRDKLTKNINQVKKFIEEAGIECTSELLEGDKKGNLGDYIFDYEKKFESDMIMIMTKKEELSFSNNISVTARYIINNSQIPVMSIKPRDRKIITKPTTAF